MLPRDFTIVSLRAFYRGGGTVPEVLEAVWARLREADDPGIFLHVAPEAALALAAQLPPFDAAAMPLWGIPFAVKDNIDVAGQPTTAACPAYAYTPAEHAYCVERLIAAGAIPVGKTNMDQFATGLVGTRTPHPVPRNACDPALVPGGSSSGSAVVVARGIVPFALGTDTAGSGRVPAALNGIVGLKPSRGAVSHRGVVPACRTLDCVSVFAHTVADAWAVFAEMAFYDPTDPYSQRIASGSPGPLRSDVRVGVLAHSQREFFGDAAAAAAYQAHVARLAQVAVVEELDLAAFIEAGKLLYAGPWVAERYATFRAFMADHAGAMVPLTRTIFESATRFSAADAFTAMYRLADLRRASEIVWDRVDALVFPTLPFAPTVAAVTAEPLQVSVNLGTYTNFVNLLDLAALAVPGAPRADRRPAGITLVAPAGADALLASLGAAYLAERPFASAVPDELIPLVVVGAHMSGLPLNQQLLDLGAVFVSADRTEPVYRLYDLPGTIRRPGMLRVGVSEGAAIAVEVWALPVAAFGKFVAGVVPPLAIGTVLLEAAGPVKGFVVEAEGVRGAKDITAFGGWRAFLGARVTVG